MTLVDRALAAVHAWGPSTRRDDELLDAALAHLGRAVRHLARQQRMDDERLARVVATTARLRAYQPHPLDAAIDALLAAVAAQGE